MHHQLTEAHFSLQPQSFTAASLIQNSWVILDMTGFDMLTLAKNVVHICSFFIFSLKATFNIYIFFFFQKQS